MESSNIKKFKKAVVSLQKLDLPNQRSCQDMSTVSGGSEDVSSENTAVDSAESNVGCTDDDDLEKKIQAFSIPVKKDGETLSASDPVALQTIKVKDSTNISNEKSKCVKAKPSSQTTKISKTKSVDLSRQDKTPTVKEKVSDDKSSLEKVKLLSSKTAVEKEKIVGKTSSSKGSVEKISKSEMKSSHRKQTIDTTSHHKQRKQKQGVDNKSFEENDSSIKQNTIKSQKQDKQQTLSTPSTSKANITTPRTQKLNTPHRNRSDRFTSDSRGEARKVKKHSNSESEKPGKEKINQDLSKSKEERKRKLSDSESSKAKKIIKHVKPVSKMKTTDGNEKSKHKNSELLETDISQKRNSLQGQSTSGSKKSTKTDKPLQTTDTVSKENIYKKETHGSNTSKSRDTTVQNKEKLRESRDKILACNKKDGTNDSVVTRSGVNKNGRKNRDTVLRKSNLGNKHSLGRLSIDGKLKQLKANTSDVSKFDRSHLNRNKSSLNNKQHEKHKSEKHVRKANGKISDVQKRKKILKKIEHSLAKSNENSSCIFEKRNVKLTHDNKHKDSIFKGRLLVAKSVFKTVSKKSDLLPSQNIGTQPYKKLWKWSHYIRMPSTMWSLHKHPQGDYVIILHISEISSFPKIIIDKCVQFKENAIPLVKLYDTEVPSLGMTTELQTLGEVCSFLKQIDTISICENFKNPSLEGSNSNCEMFMNSIVALPFTCKNCSSSTVQ